MKIIIDGGLYGRKRLVAINNNLIYLNGTDFFLLLALSIAWQKDSKPYLNKDLLSQNNTARYIYRLKKDIKTLVDIDLPIEVLSLNRQIKSLKHGNYRIKAKNISISPILLSAMEIEDGRIKNILKKLDNLINKE